MCISFFCTFAYLSELIWLIKSYHTNIKSNSDTKNTQMGIWHMADNITTVYMTKKKPFYQCASICKALASLVKQLCSTAPFHHEKQKDEHK